MISGIIHVTGEHDTGKSTFSLECGAAPEKICFFDDDVKGRSIVVKLAEMDRELGAYHDLIKLGKGTREIEFHLACRALIDGIKPGEFEAIIWDTWTRFAKTCHPMIVKEPSKYRVAWSQMGRIKGAEMWQEAERLEAQILSQLQELARTVIIVTHLKDFYLGGQKVPGKQIPASGRALERVSRMRIWLRHNEHSPIPIGLILKRLGETKITESGLRTVAVLPRKITPRADEGSLWDSIARYRQDPIGLREPREDEIPTEYELSILDEVLTPDQHHTFELMLKAGATDEAEEIDLEGPDEETLAREAREVEGSPAQIARELSEAHGTEVRVPQVLRWLKGSD